MKRTCYLFLTILMTLVLCVGCASPTASTTAKESSTSPATSSTESSTTASSAQTEKKTDFPKSSITMICPFNVGGTTDLNARLLAAKMSEILGHQVNVVNKTGGSGEVGSIELKNSRTDGYTVGCLGFIDTVITEGLKGTISMNDYEWICQVSSTPYTIVAKPGSRFSTLEEVVAYAKENPGKLTVAESGTSVKLFGVMWADQAGIDVTFVNFPSGADSCSNALGGHVEIALLTPTYIERVAAGGGKTLSISGDGLEQYPEIVTMKSMGYEVEAVASTPAFVVPKGTPQDIIDIYRDVIAQLGEDEEFKQSIKKAGFYGEFYYGDKFAEVYNKNSKAAADALARNISLFK